MSNPRGGKDSFEELLERLPELADIRESFDSALDLISTSVERGGKLFVAGNGGSMSDALHISGELLKAFRIDRNGFIKPKWGLQPGIPVWVMGINPSLASAVENDLPERGLVFAQELFAAGRERDVLLGISTSGGALNLQRAFEVAKWLSVSTISLTGDPGGVLAGMADTAIRTPGKDTAEVQEYHISVYHCLCSVLEERLFSRRGRLAGPFGTKYKCFQRSEVRRYSLRERENRTDLNRLIHPSGVVIRRCDRNDIAEIAEATASSVKEGKPVVLLMGAHPLKNGLGPLIIDLMERGIISLAAGNGACPIHDTELALCGGTSERVPETLPEGRFGFARETGEIVNRAYLEAYKRRMGAGEALGAILAGDIPLDSMEFPYREYSLFYRAYRLSIPVTVHATIGTDIVDQHPEARFEAKGYASGVDFSIFADTMTRFTGGGVVLNLSGAVTQPEVLLKSVSMAANIGKPPKGIVTAVFDLQDGSSEGVLDESRSGYYRRDVKSIVVRIPEAFGGRGTYIQGDHRVTFVAFYSHLVDLLGDGV